LIALVSQFLYAANACNTGLQSVKISQREKQDYVVTLSFNGLRSVQRI